MDFKFSLHTTKSSFCTLITFPTFFYISDSFCFSFHQLKNSLCQSIIESPFKFYCFSFWGGLIHPHSDHFWSSKVLRMRDSYLDNYVSGTFSEHPYHVVSWLTIFQLSIVRDQTSHFLCISNC